VETVEKKVGRGYRTHVRRLIPTVVRHRGENTVELPMFCDNTNPEAWCLCGVSADGDPNEKRVYGFVTCQAQQNCSNRDAGICRGLLRLKPPSES